MRCAQIDSFPQNPAEPIPAGRASPCWHIVAWFGTTAYPLSLSYDRCLALPCLALPCNAMPRNALPRPAQSGCFRILPANVMRWRWDTKIVVSSFVAGLSRNPCCRPVAFPRLCSARRPLAACLHITSLTGLFRAFRAASCSAHRIATAFMPPKPASSARGFGYFPAGVPGVFAFPGRREDNIYVYEFYVNKNFIYVYIEPKKYRRHQTASAVTPGRAQKSPSRGGAGR